MDATAGRDRRLSGAAPRHRHDMDLERRRNPRVFKWQRTVPPPVTAEDIALLRALTRFRHFDAATISGAATWDGDSVLLAALGFLRPCAVKRNGLLSMGALARIRLWLDRVEGRDIEGLRLIRDSLGWCRVVG